MVAFFKMVMVKYEVVVELLLTFSGYVQNELWSYECFSSSRVSYHWNALWAFLTIYLIETNGVAIHADLRQSQYNGALPPSKFGCHAALLTSHWGHHIVVHCGLCHIQGTNTHSRLIQFSLGLNRRWGVVSMSDIYSATKTIKGLKKTDNGSF